MGNVTGEKGVRQLSFCAGIAKPRLLRGAHAQKMIVLHAGVGGEAVRFGPSV